MDQTFTSIKSRQIQSNLEEFICHIPRGLHLTAPEVYKQALEKGLKVSLSTVYRTLNYLTSHGQMQALAGEHGRRYEVTESGHDHDHLICVKCGLTIEFEDDLIRGFGRSVAERKNYEYRNSRFDILGICQQCRTIDNNPKTEVAIKSLQQAMKYAQQATLELQDILNLVEQGKTLQGYKSLYQVLPLLKKAGNELETLLAATLPLRNLTP